MKKLIVLLALVLAAAGHLLADTETVGGYTWSYEIRDGGAYIRRDSDARCAVSPSPSGALEIPSRLGGCPVTAIGHFALANCWRLTSVTIPEGVTLIGFSTFESCSGLVSVTIPKSVTVIEDHVFWGCSSLTSVTIPEGVTAIGPGAFRDCGNLASAIIPEGVTAIEDYTFWCCSNLVSVVIPSSVRRIGKEAFFDCNALHDVKIPDSVVYLGQDAFSTSPYRLQKYREFFGQQTVNGSAGAGYALSGSTIGDHRIATLTVREDARIDSFELTDGRAFDLALRLVNESDASVLILPAGYTYETIGNANPLELPARSTNMVTVTQTDARVFLVARQPLRTLGH